MHFDDYQTEGFYDELFEALNQPRAYAAPLIQGLQKLTKSEIFSRQVSAEAVLRELGITFRTADQKDEEHIFPFDIIPRVIDAGSWKRIERGLKQRVQAINLFLTDVYGQQKILRDKAIPADIVLSSPGYLKACMGIRPRHDIYCHISGIDLIRHTDGNFYILEDNLRCPSGVSYVVENRQVLKRTFPRLFSHMKIEPVDDYPERLLRSLLHVSPVAPEETQIVLLTPGIYNSAYYEHSFLAKSMGIPLVEGQDLFVDRQRVFLKTTRGPRPVHVIYRRIDDDFLDPLVFRSDSYLGVSGLMEAYSRGHVALVNAPGNGIADDKAVYAFIPDMIRYYLGEEPILDNVPTYLCALEKDRNYVLENISKLVVKAVSQSGGYGMLIGPRSTPEEQEQFRGLIQKSPRSYIAQPTLSLSRVPTITGEQFEGRHVDLRPFILNGSDIYVQPGGLTRVALKKGSLVVNSSQGGGSKDTWVLRH